MECGREDVIKNSTGGYHFQDWISIRIVGAWAAPLGIGPAAAEVSDSPPALSVALNERQQWIMGQVRAGVRLTLKDILAHFRSEWNRSTLNRDLKALREQGLLISHPNGYYLAPPENRSSTSSDRAVNGVNCENHQGEPT